MAPLSVAFALSFMLTQPEAAASGAVAVPAWQPTSEVQAQPEPVATPAPTPVAAPPPAAEPAPLDTERAPQATPQPVGPNPPDTQPVVRAAPGNWGMTFIFGGLAPLSIGGLGDLPLTDSLMFTEIGVRRVFKRVVIPFSFGAGVAHKKTQGESPVYSAGFSASVAVLKGFRVWRRIAPYAGAFLHTHFIDSRGPGNWLFNVTVGPILGIEYYLADRVSLYGQGVFGIGPSIGKGTVDFVARAAMAAGGQLGLTFYF
jgi:hypothetical protein